MTLATFLFFSCLPFVGITLYMGTKGGYYDSDNYKGDGCAHDVKRWFQLYFSVQVFLTLLSISTQLDLSLHWY